MVFHLREDYGKQLQLQQNIQSLWLKYQMVKSLGKPKPLVSEEEILGSKEVLCTNPAHITNSSTTHTQDRPQAA